MERKQRDKRISARIDADLLDAAQAIADTLYDGNLALFVRKSIADAVMDRSSDNIVTFPVNADRRQAA